MEIYGKESEDEEIIKKRIYGGLKSATKRKRIYFNGQLTLADKALFNRLKFSFNYFGPKKFRESILPNINDW